MPYQILLLFFRQISYRIPFITMEYETAAVSIDCKAVSILISWLLLQKPADLDLYCFEVRVYSNSLGQGIRLSIIFQDFFFYLVNHEICKPNVEKDMWTTKLHWALVDTVSWTFLFLRCGPKLMRKLLCPFL